MGRSRKCAIKPILNQPLNLDHVEVLLQGKKLSRAVFSLIFLLLVIVSSTDVHGQACALIPHGGGESISPSITVESTGAQISDGTVVQPGTSLRLDAVVTSEGGCSLVGAGCSTEYLRTVNHINIQSDISSTALNGHYVEGYVFGWDESHSTAYYQLLDSHASNSTGPLHATLLYPGRYQYHFWAVIDTTPCNMMPDQTEMVTITVYVGDWDGENQGPTDCISSAGKPINVSNGNMYLQQTDYRLDGLGEGLDLTRTYNSQSTRTGLFGLGWTSTYEESLKIYGDNLLKLNIADGRGFYFAKRDTGEFTPQSPLDIHAQIAQKVDNSFTLTFKDGRVDQFDSGGRLLSQTDRNNNTTTLTYDSNGFLTSVTDASGRTLTFSYGYWDLVSSVSDSMGTIATYTNYRGRMESVRYPDGSGFNFYHNWFYDKLGIVTDVLGNYLESHTYDSQGRALTSQVANNGTELYTLNYVSATETDVTDALNHVTKYFYVTSKGRNVVTQVEGSCGCGNSQIQTWTYDNQLNVTTKTDALSHSSTYTYDSEGNRLTETNSLGTTTFTYNSLGEVLSVTDPLSGVWTNTYDTAGNLLTTKDALNHTTTFTYDSHGQLLTVTDPRNNASTLAYDTNGNLTSVTDPLNHQSSAAYDTRGRVTSVTNALSQTTNYEYDLASRLKKITYPDSNFVSFTYDLAGRRTKITDARGNDTNLAYDAAYRLTSVTNAANAVTTYAYDTMSSLTGVTDALNRTTNYSYDEFNRLTSVVYPEATSGAGHLHEDFAYDLAGNLLQKTDTAGRVSSFCYDNANRLINSTDPAQKVTSYEYNARSQMTAVIDAINQRYEFVYDALGQLTQEKKGTSSKVFSYDAAGNRTQRTDYNNAVTNYSFDELNRLTYIEYPDSTSATYNYDALSRLSSAANANGAVTLAYDNRGRVSSVNDVFGQTVGYGYDANGNRTQLTIGGATNANYQYDVLNRLTQVSDAASLAFTFAYDSTNKLTSRSAPNGVASTYQYDGLDRLTRLTHAKGATTIADFQYQINAANDITQIIDGAGTHSYSYDSLDRLTAATHPSQPNESYSYDDVGNRTASQQGSTYTYQAFNRLTAANGNSYSYDAKGNLIAKTDTNGSWSYSWDSENRLKQTALAGGLTVNYSYDALGRRIARSDSNGATSNFVYDGADIVRDLNANLSTAVEYLNGPGVDNKLQQAVSGTKSYYGPDHQSTTRGLSDSNGVLTSSQSYDSFGNSVTGSAVTRYGYTGREFDSDTGLSYYRARWYEPQQGRFIGEDPLGFSGGINLYGYVGNNPLNWRDPTGLSPDNPYDLIPQAGWEVIGEIGNLSAGFADALTTIPMSGGISLTRQIRIWQGIDQFVDKCGWAYHDGSSGAFIWEIAVGTSIGGKSLEKPQKWSGKEWSHWIPDRYKKPEKWPKWVPDRFRTPQPWLNRIIDSPYNGNYRTIGDHALNDPSRWRTMPKPWKRAHGDKPNPLWQSQFNRLPDWMKGAGAGAALGLSQRAGSDCGCR